MSQYWIDTAFPGITDEEAQKKIAYYRGIDVLVAKAMGLDVLGETWASPDPDSSYRWNVLGELYKGSHSTMQPVYLYRCSCDLERDPEFEELYSKALGHYTFCLNVVEFYSADIATARTMEDWIEEKGPEQIKAYTTELCAMVGYNHHWTNLKLLWAVVHATPEHRCQAFLRAWGEGERE